MSLQALVKAHGFEEFWSNFEKEEVDHHRLRNTPEDDSDEEPPRQEIKKLQRKLGIPKERKEEFVKLHRKCRLSIHSVHLKLTETISTTSPFRIVLVGHQGSGKTAVFNSLTGMSEESRAGSESVTRVSKEALSACGRFLIVDTPGLGSTVSKIQHAQALRAALSAETETHLVVFVDQLSARVGDAKKSIDLHYGVLRPFHNNLLVLFTQCDRRHNPNPGTDYFDLSTETANDELVRSSPGYLNKMAYIKAVDDVHNAAGFIFYHHGVSDGWLANNLVKAASRVAPMRYSYTDFEFAWHFDTARDFTRQELDKISGLKKEFADLCDSTLKKLKEEDFKQSKWSGSKKSVFFSDLMVKLTSIADQQVNKFTEIIQDECTPEVFALYLAVKKDMAEPLKRMSNELQFLNQDAITHGTGNYRRCTYCQQIWFKNSGATNAGSLYMGCDGMTTCGNRSRALDIPENAGLKYEFVLSENRNTPWDLSWKESTMDFHASSFNAKAMQNQEYQVQIEFEFAPRELQRLAGVYVKEANGTFTKLHSYHGPTPILKFADGRWCLFRSQSAPNSEWCARATTTGSASNPEGGAWEIHGRFIETVADPRPVRYQEWVARVDGVEKVVKVTDVDYYYGASVGSRLTGSRRWMSRLEGFAIDNKQPFNIDSDVHFLYRNMKCDARFSKSVGCGNSIVWSELPIVDDETLAELKLEVEKLGHRADGDFESAGFQIRPDLMEICHDSRPTTASTLEFEDSGVDEFEYAFHFSE